MGMTTRWAGDTLMALPIRSRVKLRTTNSTRSLVLSRRQLKYWYACKHHRNQLQPDIQP